MEQALIRQEQKPLTASEILAQVRLIQEVMNAVMKEGHHYGKIPGTPKPTLYKPGAEKLLSTFHIGVDPEDRITDLSTEDEIRYRVLVRGFRQGDGEPLGTGLGECSSNEEKYKWRKPICDEEFEETASDRKRTVWKKGDGGKVYQQKQVRMNPIDVANTILKMAKKRALVDMTLTVTAASDIFDQDLEDLPDGTEIAANGKPPIREPQKKEPAKQSESSEMISEAQRKRFYAVAKSTGATDEQIKEWLYREYDLKHTTDIPKKLYDEICENMKKDLSDGPAQS